MSNLEIYQTSLELIYNEEWRELQELQRDTYTALLPGRSQDEIDELVMWHDPERFVESHLDPNSEVGDRFNLNQEYSHPRLVVASALGEVAAWGYAADNVSGPNHLVRTIKSHSPERNYRWLREVVVAPKFQNTELMNRVLSGLIEGVDGRRIATIYPLSEESPELAHALQGIGFKSTRTQMVEAFGEGSQPVQQERFAIKVGRLRTNLA